MPSVLMSDVVIYDRPLGETGMRAISGALLNKLYLDQPIPAEAYANVVHEDQIRLKEPPKQTVVKLAKADHVDAFFREGTLQLGTFDYFSKSDQPEVRDTQEGAFLLVGRTDYRTIFVRIAGGFNHYAFCCYEGEGGKDCAERFGFDAAFEIADVAAFSAAIGSELGSHEAWWGSCVYSKDKVVVGSVPNDFRFDQISPRLLELANEAKYFVQPSRKLHQREFRFLWRVPEDVTEPRIVKCPEAVPFCRKL